MVGATDDANSNAFHVDFKSISRRRNEHLFLFYRYNFSGKGTQQKPGILVGTNNLNLVSFINVHGYIFKTCANFFLVRPPRGKVYLRKRRETNRLVLTKNWSIIYYISRTLNPCYRDLRVLTSNTNMHKQIVLNRKFQRTLMSGKNVNGIPKTSFQKLIRVLNSHP